MLTLGITLSILGGLLFLASIYMIAHMMNQFCQMKSSCMIMESSFRDHVETMSHTKEFIGTGLEAAEARHNETKRDYEGVQVAYATVQKEYARLTDSNNALQERINRYEKDRKKPMSPDVVFN